MKKIIIFLLSILWLTSCNNDSEMAIMNEDENNTSLGFSENDVVKGHMRIKLKEEPTEQIAVRSVGGQVTTGIRALDASATTLGITRMERTFPYAGRYEGRTRKAGLHLWYDVWFSEQVTTTRALNEVLNLQDIEIVSPVPKIKLHTTFMASELVGALIQNEIRGTAFPWNDPEFGKQWNLSNLGSQSWQIEGADIRLTDVWKQYNGNPNIIVAVVDEGVDVNHPDLKDNIWSNGKEIPGNGIDDDNNGFVDDIQGFNFVKGNGIITPMNHGTHVAGIIGAVNNNEKGVCGIAGGDGTPNSGIKIMCCQILESYDQSADNSPQAIKYAADNGAVICQNSWGYTRKTESTIYPADKDAIDYFIRYAGRDEDGNQLPNSPMKGGIVLFATNNNNSSNWGDASPADYEQVIGVAAIGPDYKKGTYSNYGTYIDICAPGGKDRYFNETAIYSTVTGNSYAYMAGASMACPHVSGVAALVIEKNGVGKPGFTAEQLKEILFSTAYDISSYNPDYIGQLGHGCVNATAALQAKVPELQPEEPYVPDVNDPKNFILITNPITDGKLLYRINTPMSGSSTISIYNATGGKVFSKNLKTKQYTIASLDISKLSAGYYTLQYECQGAIVKRKFIKY